MSIVRIALAQTNPIVGDVVGNTARIIDLISRARQAGAAIVAFPELSVAGYPPRDLLLKPRFVKANVEAVQRIAESCVGIVALVGFVEPNADTVGRSLRNAAAFCADGRVQAVRHKSLLPTYDVFDEQRYFEPGPEVALIQHDSMN
ncbi:MAG TPA: nitrilase-related carbon-nitrogen hydrolase, partial [Phycisphaerae bacterium]|nr:nitrilase-related carbon-nitrogen hydrolase [Phycisphaerae bacterium]